MKFSKSAVFFLAGLTVVFTARQIYEQPKIKAEQQKASAETIFHNDTRQRMGRIFPKINIAAPGEFPFFVVITNTPRLGDNFTCGGALIADTWVLTSAQCVALASVLTVTARIYYSPDNSTPAVVVNSTGIATIHPGFKQNYLINDIALVWLQSPFHISTSIQPIKVLASKKKMDFDCVTLRTMGFGQISHKHDRHPRTIKARNEESLTMRRCNCWWWSIFFSEPESAPPSEVFYVDLVQVSKSKCLKMTEEIFVSYPPNTSCLSSSLSMRGFCSGDKGGPVIYTYPGEIAPTLIGVNSISQGCPSAYPMAYTRVVPYRKWIKSHVKTLIPH